MWPAAARTSTAPPTAPRCCAASTRRYFTPGGKLLGSFVGADVQADYATIWRLLELSYRCNICRRCAMVCPVGVDNALLAREIRKIFSQEMGIAATELLKKGSRQHLKAGSTTGMTPAALRDMMEFAEEEIEERTGKKIKIPIDKKGADILLIHNAGEFISLARESLRLCRPLRGGGHQLDPQQRDRRLRCRQLWRVVRRCGAGARGPAPRQGRPGPGRE